jgi:hypothetical protein
MPKKYPVTEERFQEWLAKFRKTGNSSPVLIASQKMSDEKLREYWKDAQRILNKPPRRPRTKKYPTPIDPKFPF